MLAGILAALLAAPVRGAAVAFEPALVEGEVTRTSGLRAPYVARFEKDGLVLTYVAARHEVTRANATMDLIRGVFEAEKPAFLIIEGVPNGSEKGFLGYARRNCGEESCKAGEPAFAALLAEERRVPFAGGEPHDEQVLPEMAKLGYGRRDVFNFYFVRRIPQYRREGRLSEARLPALYADYLESYPLFQNDGFSYGDFLKWYRERNGKPFELDAFEDDEAAPKSRGEFSTQKISAAVDLARNRFVVRLLAEKLAERRNVVIVYGASHFEMERRALARMLGEPVLRKSPPPAAD